MSLRAGADGGKAHAELREQPELWEQVHSVISMHRLKRASSPTLSQTQKTESE